MTTSDVLAAMKQSTKFIEGKSPADRKCSCEKCVVSLYRHTHEPDLADSRHSFWDYLRFCVIEHCDHPSQRGLGTGAHIHGLGGKPDGVDADHWASSRIKRAHPSGSEDGHFTVSFCCPKGTSILTAVC
ncbi:hypothetical protein [Pseudomonas gingeri]|uniref:hypothetical protein n=1 Tax=Pseudomonas gingeri TaxID=117681 RepID=UPI0015A0508D|nr:hypothetical protein [Pseudomonas gingeri]NVZ99159.1 hypothetical protein [Pseudomonas gingeri]NWA13204.1 hypothetical protein [Pseudomonas gingeri]NWA55465.1 hypothetical protein [Pseudomonas gingeri]NWA95681.1 hypothetical protein [Pseudomonas gingeri]NWB00768.1 hypothetical protein [Pseudomonas gingeri]